MQYAVLEEECLRYEFKAPRRGSYGCCMYVYSLCSVRVILVLDEVIYESRVFFFSNRASTLVVFFRDLVRRAHRSSVTTVGGSSSTDFNYLSLKEKVTFSVLEIASLNLPLYLNSTYGLCPAVSSSFSTTPLFPFFRLTPVCYPFFAMILTTS
jgi:hypothetical protein